MNVGQESGHVYHANIVILTDCAIRGLLFWSNIYLSIISKAELLAKYHTSIITLSAANITIMPV